MTRPTPPDASWRKDKRSAAARGYGKAWQRARAAHLAANPLCKRCLRDGLIVQATVVDHVVPHLGDQILFWNERNWQSLCSHCHSSDKQMLERSGVERATTGLDGWPVGVA